jgi:hypothetical protein
MYDYKVTIKRVEKFYDDIIVQATSKEEARKKADLLAKNGYSNFDYTKESRIIDEYIVEIRKVRSSAQKE